MLHFGHFKKWVSWFFMMFVEHFGQINSIFNCDSFFGCGVPHSEHTLFEMLDKEILFF